MENITGTEISVVIDGMKVNNSDRATISIMLHDVVFDNQKAIFDLVKLGHIRSASALLRVLFEAHVKGIWLYSCATDKQISQFKKDSVKSAVKPKCNIAFHEMISDIETEMPHLNGTLSKFKENHWKGLNCLTHSGTMQFSYEFVDGKMRRKCSNGYPKTLLDFSERFAISSLGSVGKIVGCVNIIKCSIKLSKERLGIAI
jgi:hypothetical protein